MTGPAPPPSGIAPQFAGLTLGDKYRLDCDRIIISGTQAVVRLLLLQSEMDRRAGLNTAGFVSGYRGSPLGGLDRRLLEAEPLLRERGILFQPGLNEELAATAVWGSQQAEMRGEGRHDGVFGLWYAKGPGVDRSGDVLRHANLAGSARYGGVLALMGDDHTAESSTTAHQSEFHFVDVMIPILNPAGVQEILDYGLYGWALSRFAGTWVGLKCVKDTIESTASVYGGPGRVAPVVPDDFRMPSGGLNIRPRDPVLEQEARLQDFKRDAVTSWLRANRLDRIVFSGGRRARLGVVTVGKSYLDVRQALDELGIDEERANEVGLRLYKLACPWPLETSGLFEFVRGLDLVIVVEEKRSLVEVQVREELYGSANQPVCVGKKDEKGQWLFPVKGALDAHDIAVAIGRRLLAFHDSEELRARLATVERAQKRLAESREIAGRTPHFCSGCPHNASTKVPEGMRAYAGIGCHYMAQWMDRATDGFTQMGGEGANWIGEAPFSQRGHVIQNLGDGTYDHSGVLALRWAVAAGVNMTYKILFNDAVAMTGGQPLEGGLTVDAVARQVAAEGVSRIALVTDEPQKYGAERVWPAGMSISHRRELEGVQRELARVAGVTVLIYDQTCAAEKRRKRKRGAYPDPDRRVVINELLCEGCGDCGAVSNCLSLQPVETRFGRKRRVDQTSCNKDYLCVEGFCPAIVTVEGGRLRARRGDPALADDEGLAEPDLPGISSNRPYSILVTGVGGTGVVTLGAVLGMAAHLEGKGCGAIDMAGLAQKGGAVYTHMKIARSPQDIHAIRVAAEDADLVLGGDLIVTGTRRVLAAARRDRSAIVVNSAEAFPGEFARTPDFVLPARAVKELIREAGGAKVSFLDASAAAKSAFGLTTAANFVLLGFAWQKGFLPLSRPAILRAIELNGQGAADNAAAFRLGRRLAAGASKEDSAHEGVAPDEPKQASFDEFVETRRRFLADYQDEAYARRYLEFVNRIAQRERASTSTTQFAAAAADGLFRLMAIKDEYEVGRLYADGSFSRQLEQEFENFHRLEFHLAPPLLLGDADKPAKIAFGPWMMWGFRLLARARRLRGTALDPFRHLSERQVERKLVDDYRADIEHLCGRLSPQTLAVATDIARIPQEIRGFGHVKAAAIERARRRRDELFAELGRCETSVSLAAE